ncbi:MAG: hypothetical protein AWU57_220 [Marinobacter sp. T13-3]|nr:MAG: hypothetical protein AWU57_220 [Marinobacter sp. T13-3]
MLIPVFIEQHDDSAYGVIVPDLPGCHSAGDTLEDALFNAEDAIDLHMEDVVRTGGTFPVPSSLSELKHRSTEFHDGFWAVVNVDEVKYFGKAQRINISLPSNLIARIDRYVRSSRSFNDRSHLLAVGALKIMGD